MNTPDTPPINNNSAPLSDADAEAVLLALAKPPLEWDVYENGGRAETSDGFYQVIAIGLTKRIGRRTRYYAARRYVYVTQPTHPYETTEHESPHRYAHKVDGIAACERHYWNNTWDE